MSKRRCASVVALLAAAGVAVPGASAAPPTFERIVVDETIQDEFLSEECGVDVETRIAGRITVRTFERGGKGLVELGTINVTLTATTEDGRTFRFRDVGADLTRVRPDGTMVLQIVGQIPFQFAGALKINLDTDEVILEPRSPRGEKQLARACAVLTGES
jgi:hypothetical protein